MFIYFWLPIAEKLKINLVLLVNMFCITLKDCTVKKDMPLEIMKYNPKLANKKYWYSKQFTIVFAFTEN